MEDRQLVSCRICGSCCVGNTLLGHVPCNMWRIDNWSQIESVVVVVLITLYYDASFNDLDPLSNSAVRLGLIKSVVMQADH